ncbi:MAG: response regulator [Gammaproteobacteria bacterium]|nr:MAG: response regulator [Gammaproteobacteria bacterium]
MSGKNILLIEDDLQFHKFVKLALESEGFSVTSASNGLTASHYLETHTPDLIITDLLMPEKDGVRLITEVKMSHPDTPVIAMSGGQSAFSPAFLEAAGTLGATYTLDKPFDCEQLLELVAKCFD